MKINRLMLSLFFEIKRSIPIKNREKLKLSAPNIGNKLVILHSHTNDPRLKDLIERFLHQAGKQWTKKITPLDAEAHSHYIVKKKMCDKLLRASH